ncbi:CHY zinc finger protein [Endozoicomonas sp. ISHI1]|uniref:CHY zinc finger protein n=3 Tax=Endozoicomonas TaxID=305899 RepID=UPI0021484C53|nr:CHY zinc finger protein [Endozoicomonas sp. ISHI1]
MHFYRLLIASVLSLNAIAIAPLCNSSTNVDRHNPGGQKVRLEINDGTVPQVVSQWQLYSENITDSGLETGQTRNNTVTLARDRSAGNADFPGGSNRGFFYSFPPPPSRSGGGGWLPLERTALKTHHAVGIKAGNDVGKPSGKVPDKESKDENNDHQKEQRDEPEGQESRSPGEWNDGSGNNVKDDNGEEQLKQHPSLRELVRLSNELTRQAHTFHSLQKPSLQVPLIAPEISHSDNTSNDTTASNRNRFNDSIQQVNSSHSASGGCSPDLPMDRYLQQGARPKRRALANQQNASSQKQLKERPLYGDHQANKAHNRSDFEVSGINQNFLSKHSTDDSLPIELKRHAQEKEKKKRQQIEELAEEVEGLRIKNRALTIEAQGLRMENRDLANMNQNLMAESLRHHDLMRDSETTNQCLREHIKKLYVDLESKRGIIDYLIHQAAENAAQRLTAANNPAMPGNDTAYFDSHQPLSPRNEQSLSSIDPTEPTSVNNIPRGEHPPIAETSPTMSGSDEPNIDNEEPNPWQEAITTCVEKTLNIACDHYHRLCRVNFECCARYFPCHHCHNVSDGCDVKDLEGIDAKKLQCCICNYEGGIMEDSQTCPGCNQQMSEYFCAKCKLFSCKEKKPYHCDQCGICRLHRDKSFHCDVCNACLDIRLKDNHKCRENSGHDPCCICLEDVFHGCLILPCSHKVHRDCAIAMIENGIRTCPMCRQPLPLPSDENNN